MMAIDEIARAMAIDARNGGSGGGTVDTYTKSEIDTKLSGKADAGMVEEMQSDIEANKAALADVVNAGKKNLLDTSKLPSVIVRDSITITSNEDGSLTISRKNETGSAIIPIANFNAGLTVTAGQQAGNNLDGLGTYIVSTGLKEDIGIGIQVCYSTTGSDAITLKSVRRSDEFEYSEEYPYVWFRLLIASDAEFQESVTIRPMVCKKSLYDISPDFKQYAMSNAELTQKVEEMQSDIEANKAALADVVNAGQKNLLNPQITSPITKNGVTCTPNGDGTFTLNGMADDLAIFVLVDKSTEFSGKEVTLSGCPEGGNYNTKFSLYIANVETDKTFQYDNGSGRSFTMPSDEHSIRIVVRKNVSAENLVFKPMLCEKSLYDIAPDFKPYAMSNEELTESLQRLTNGENGLKIYRNTVSVERPVSITQTNISYPEGLFEKAPIVAVTPKTSDPVHFQASIASSNEKGFILYTSNSSESNPGSNMVVNYIAIGV